MVKTKVRNRGLGRIAWDYDKIKPKGSNRDGKGKQREMVGGGKGQPHWGPREPGTSKANGDAVPSKRGAWGRPDETGGRGV